MVRVFEALDNEFATSTGSNVNSSPGQSSFDYPPNSTTNLVITSKPGDANPKLFELGETYELSWAGSGGGGTITDATIIRSDPAPDSGGVIVFEGLDENGSLTQIIWTPDFDLETWYFNNFVGGQPPEFYTSDQNAAYTHGVVCFGADTPIRTHQGRRKAGDIKAGEKVWTLDAGYCEVLWVGHQTVPGTGSYAPVRFETGVIRNNCPLFVSQQHRILIRSVRAELMFANHEVLVPAKVMIGMEGVTQDPCRTIHYVHLLLRNHHLINAAGGLCESLFVGEMTDLITADQMSPETRRIASRVNHVAARPILTYREALCLLGRKQPKLPVVAV